jgi:predicted SprT family Zn-dependent metalloprotease
MSRYGADAGIPVSTPLIHVEHITAAAGIRYTCSWCKDQFISGTRVKANRSGDILWSRCICEPCRITLHQLPATAHPKVPAVPVEGDQV